MAIITSTLLLLDGAGQPAEGFIYWKQSARFNSPEGIVTTTQGRAKVTAGVISTASGEQLRVPQTPTDQVVVLVEDFGSGVVTWTTSVPAGEEIDYSALPQVIPPAPSGGIPDWVSSVLAAVSDAGAARDAAVVSATAAGQSATDAGTAADAAADAVAAVPGLVAGTLADNPDVIEAAAELAQSDVGLMRSVPINEDLVSFTDGSDHRSWLEIDAATGGPSSHASDMIWTGQEPRVAEAAQAAGLADLDEDDYGVTFAIRDMGGRMPLYVTSDGEVVIPKLRSPNSLDPGSVSVEFLSADVASRLWPSQLGTPFQIVGDSQTAFGSGYGGFLSAALGGAAVTIEAMGGHGPNEIAARQGGRPARATVTGNAIPATVTPVALTLDVDVLWRTDTTTGTTTRPCVLAGVPGTLIRDNVAVTYTFVRDVAGAAVWVSPGGALRTVNSITNRGAIQVFLVGRNGIHWTDAGMGGGAPWTPQTIVDRVAQMVDFMHERGDRYLILELFPSQSDTTTDRRDRVTTYNTLLRERFPDAFVPTTYYLLNQAMTDMGVTPTAQDLTDIANGVPPTSLVSDGPHLNDLGNQALATHVVAQEIIQRGWIN